MANRNVVSAYSAMPSRLTFTTLVEEGLRRLRNTSLSLVQVEKEFLLRQFNLWMSKGGHDEDFWLNVMRKVLLKYQDLIKKEARGERRLYRSKKEIISAKKANKERKT